MYKSIFYNLISNVSVCHCVHCSLYECVYIIISTVSIHQYLKNTFLYSLNLPSFQIRPIISIKYSVLTKNDVLLIEYCKHKKNKNTFSKLHALMCLKYKEAVNGYSALDNI